MRLKATLWVIMFSVCVATPGVSQVVKFRIETTDLDGNAISSVSVGEQFLLSTYTKHHSNMVSQENSGVFAAYLDIEYDPSMVAVSGDVAYGDSYQIAQKAELSTAGLLDDIGAVASVEMGLKPIGLGEHRVFSVPMIAIDAGKLSFVGSESGSYPHHDVLVYGLDYALDPVDVDFGGSVSMEITHVPETSHVFGGLLPIAIVVLRGTRRR